MRSWFFPSVAAGPAAAFALFPSPPPEAAPQARETDPFLQCLFQARAASARHDSQEAVEWLDRALEIQPQSGLARFCRAICLLELDRVEEALGALEDAARDAPDAPQVRVHVARVLARHGLHREALDALAHALREAPELAGDLREDAAFAAMRDHPAFLQALGCL